jgi:Icc-related predicted phosphoesterase
MRDPNLKLRVAAVGDLHCREHDHGRFRTMVRQINESADILLLCGDLTDRGFVSEGKVLAEELSALRVPAVAVFGNHDLEGGHAEEIAADLQKVGVRCLDGDIFIFEKVFGVAGIKGFGGGFGRATLQAFGEGQTKAYVQEAVSEALKLESALNRLETPKRVAIMHYAPILGTCEGENPEIRAFLGTSRLAMPIDEFEPDAVFHGHAHHGTLTGKTEKGVPVYNVAMPLISKHTPEQRFTVVEI